MKMNAVTSKQGWRNGCPLTLAIKQIIVFLNIHVSIMQVFTVLLENEVNEIWKMNTWKARTNCCYPYFLKDS